MEQPIKVSIGYPERVVNFRRKINLPTSAGQNKTKAGGGEKDGGREDTSRLSRDSMAGELIFYEERED